MIGCEGDSIQIGGDSMYPGHISCGIEGEEEIDSNEDIFNADNDEYSNN